MTHKPTAAVSIGNLGKVFTDIRNHRAKGFLTEVHTSIAEVAGRLRHVAMEHSDVSRISVRVLVGRNVDPALASKIQIPWKHGNLACEAVITVNQGVIGSLLYFGSNAVTRTTSSKTIAAEWALLGSLLIEKRSKKELPQDFALEILKKPSQSDIDQLIKIYKKAFTSYLTEFTPEVIRAMLAANIVAVVRDAEGRIAAVSQAEIARFTAAGEEWRLVELSETASHPDFRGQGLAYACKEKVIEQFRGSEKTIVYAEPRANLGAILMLNLDLGLTPVGRLDKHCLIDSSARDVPQEGKFGNLFVFYLSTQAS